MMCEKQMPAGKRADTKEIKDQGIMARLMNANEH